MHGRQEELEAQFAEVQKVASVYHPYSMPFEHFDVFYCRGAEAAAERDLAAVEELELAASRHVDTSVDTARVDACATGGHSWLLNVTRGQPTDRRIAALTGRGFIYKLFT